MMQWLRAGLSSVFSVGVLACVMAVLVAMPVLQARGDGGPCHAGSGMIASSSHHDAHDHSPSTHIHHASSGIDVAHTELNPGKRDANSKPDCCLPGFGVALLPSGFSLDGGPTATAPLPLPMAASFHGHDPSAPRKPPRTTDMATLVA
jgi:hypothetical protein